MILFLEIDDFRRFFSDYIFGAEKHKNNTIIVDYSLFLCFIVKYARICENLPVVANMPASLQLIHRYFSTTLSMLEIRVVLAR